MARVRYKAAGQVHVNLKVCGLKKHLSFIPSNGGGSYYITEDELLQKAIEKCSFYGKVIVRDALFDRAEAAKAAAEQSARPGKKADGEKAPVVIKVSSLDDAKDYIATKTGISRTKLRSKAQIRDAAKSVNVSFEGIEI